MYRTRELTLDADVVRKLGPGELELGESPQDVLERSRAPQVLLLQPEELALVHVVIGVENLGLMSALLLVALTILPTSELACTLAS